MDHQHKISLWTAILMNINIMVGVGIFFGPPLMAKEANFASFLGWPIVALIFLPIVLSIATMARMFPGAGSFYNYCKNIINPTAGFLSGWAFYLGYTGVAALQTIVLREMLMKHFPMNGFLFSVIFIALISLFSLLSIKTIGKIQNTGTLFKMLPLLFVLAIFLGYWNPNFRITMPSIMKLPGVVPMAVFGFWGFECCCAISHLIKGDKRNASRAILIAFFATATIYTFFHIGLLHIMGPNNLIAHGAENFVQFLGINSAQIKSIFSIFISFTMSLAFVNAIFSIFTATTSTLQALAGEKILPYSNIIEKQSSRERPWVAIIIQGLVTLAILAATSSKFLLLSIVNLGILTAFILTLSALLIFQKRNKVFKTMPITIISFFSWALFVYFSWLKIGPTNLSRALATLPLVAAMAAGFAMFTYKKKSAGKTKFYGNNS